MSPDASASFSDPEPDLSNDWPELEVLRLRYIHRMIKHAGGNKSHAAKMLGIDRRTLNRTLARARQKERAAAVFAQRIPVAR